MKIVSKCKYVQKFSISKVLPISKIKNGLQTILDLIHSYSLDRLIYTQLTVNTFSLIAVIYVIIWDVSVVYAFMSGGVETCGVGNYTYKIQLYCHFWCNYVHARCSLNTFEAFLHYSSAALHNLWIKWFPN